MTFTDWIVLGIIAAIAVSDVVLVWYRIPTYSQRMRVWGSRVSFFPYAWGVLGGHFWAPMDPIMDWWVTLIGLVVIGLALSALHAILRRLEWRFVKWLPVCVYLPAGIPIGAVLWSQGT